ncbi:MAG: transposase family protein, partial [Nocardioidaceae bacterium]
SAERGWRHLDSCAFLTFLYASPPRVRCPEHGVRQVLGDSLRIDGQAAERASVQFVHFDPPGICHSSEHHHVRDLDDGELSDILRV